MSYLTSKACICVALFIISANFIVCLNTNNIFTRIFSSLSSSPTTNDKSNNNISINRMKKTIVDSGMSWDELSVKVLKHPMGIQLDNELKLRQIGEGKPHTDNHLRLFGSTGEPRVTFYKDAASWCPYCQKVWMLLELKQIPHRVEKINMRSYGDKPPAFLSLVPNGLLPAVKIDGQIQTESIEIMLNLDRLYTGSKHKSMWPTADAAELNRAQKLMKLERNLFSSWCNLVFRGGGYSLKQFESDLDIVNRELGVTASPWFLNEISIVDLQFITHIERMLASCAYWSGLKIRNNGSDRWSNIDRWLNAFEGLPSYMATKSDYYTHVKDIPPQYGEGQFTTRDTSYADTIDGLDGSWSLPLKPFDTATDIEPVSIIGTDSGASIDASSHCVEAAFKLVKNHENIVKFALRGCGSAGVKRFQAPLADPYAKPNLDYIDDMDNIMKYVVEGLLVGYNKVHLPSTLSTTDSNSRSKSDLIASVQYIRDRVGVPRDMSYPAARELRAHLNWICDHM